MVCLVKDGMQSKGVMVNGSVKREVVKSFIFIYMANVEVSFRTKETNFLFPIYSCK